jgi:hypothetical protein
MFKDNLLYYECEGYIYIIKNIMSLPNISFKEFAKNPIVALLFMCLIAIGYLYLDNKSTLTTQIVKLEKEVNQLKDDYKELNEKFIITITKLNNRNKKND